MMKEIGSILYAGLKKLIRDDFYLSFFNITIVFFDEFLVNIYM